MYSLKLTLLFFPPPMAIQLYRCVEGSNLFVCGNYIYNHYVDCKDTNYYLSSDQINDVLCLPPSDGDMLHPVIACQDNSLRILKVVAICVHTCISSCGLGFRVAL